MTSKKVFITGISGCIGHYLFDQLTANKEYEFFLLVRDPQRLRFNYQNDPRIHLLIGEMAEIEKFQAELKAADYLIHLAAGWGRGETNYHHTLKLFELLDPQRCQKVIYFSTASILSREHLPFKEAETLGTCYIWSKYFTLRDAPKLAIYPKMKILFPTLVFGGDANHPFSHVTSGLKSGQKWLKLLRFFKIEGGVHFIHAEDIATMAKFLLENEVPEKELVLGYNYLSIDEIMDKVCRHLKLRRWFKIKIPFWLIKRLVDHFKIQVSAWDLFCAEYKYFRYKTVNPTTFGLGSRFQTLEAVLKEYLKE